MKKNKTYLVTGGCGFIGSHLSDALVRLGHKVIVLDNLSTGKKSNLQEPVELVIGDIRDVALVNKLMRKVDGCFHLAAILSLVLCNEDWLGTHSVNLTGTINIFNAARFGKNKKPVPVIYASSCAIYGNNNHLPLTEKELPQPLSSYGADKAGCEYHARAAFEVFGVPTTGLRIFNVYGPRQDIHSMYSGVITIFLEDSLTNKPMVIYGNGKQTRDFVYVEDVVAFFIKSMQQQKLAANIYNVCMGKGISIEKLAILLARLRHTPSEILYKKPRPGDVLHSLGSPSKAKRVLGAKAKIPLPQGLQKLIAFYH